MKRLFAGLALAFCAVLGHATTFVPVQLLNPAGSTSGWWNDRNEPYRKHLGHQRNSRCDFYAEFTKRNLDDWQRASYVDAARQHQRWCNDDGLSDRRIELWRQHDDVQRRHHCFAYPLMLYLALLRERHLA